MSFRDLALQYVREMSAKGYTVEDAEKEICYGKGEPGQPSFEISHGVVTVGKWEPEPFRTKFADLADELEMMEEPNLFESTPATAAKGGGGR